MWNNFHEKNGLSCLKTGLNASKPRGSLGEYSALYGTSAKNYARKWIYKMVNTTSTNNGAVLLLPPDEGSFGNYTPEYQLSSRVATSQLKEPRVMKVDTRECNSQRFPSKGW